MGIRQESGVYCQIKKCANCNYPWRVKKSLAHIGCILMSAYFSWITSTYIRDVTLKLRLMLTAAVVFLFTAGDSSSASIRGHHSPEVQARLESGPCAAAHSQLAERNGFLQLRLHGYQASFLMSTLRNLAHFLEDDSAPQVLPMEISIRDTHINLNVRLHVNLYKWKCELLWAVPP